MSSHYPQRMNQLYITLNLRKKRTLPSDMVTNPKNDESYCITIVNKSVKILGNEVEDVEEPPKDRNDMDQSHVKRKIATKSLNGGDVPKVPIMIPR